MGIYTWTSYLADQYTAMMQHGDPIPALKDVGFLYDDPVTFDTNGSPMFTAWMRSSRDAVNCYESVEQMTVQAFMALDFSDTGGT